jgi:hypothetical protein
MLVSSYPDASQQRIGGADCGVQESGSASKRDMLTSPWILSLVVDGIGRLRIKGDVLASEVLTKSMRCAESSHLGLSLTFEYDNIMILIVIARVLFYYE